MKFKQFILLGPPGVGVRAQANTLSDRWRIPHVSMGKLIFEAIVAQSEIGFEALEYVEAEALVPDALVMKLIRKRFEQPDVMFNGWILDGFPRTLGQARALDEWLSAVGLSAPTVVYLKAMTGLLINRLAAEKGPGASISSIRRQLEHHQEETAPLLEYYQQRDQLVTINGSLSFAEVTGALTQLGEETGAARLIKDEAELDSLLAKKSLLVVDCMASWCGSCKAVTPLIDQLAETYGDRVNVMKIDYDANKRIPERFGLKGMPAVMFFKDGELKETLTGVKPYQAYNAVLTRFLE
ncbi:MAG: nucleoside monophosphate kinase [Leptolyngbyaceae cyanobacterium MO_188.B28]|nr:nucleoside monophosphate kinase [Leptolyngbyaceae cyanobacterium MO_188.B28]